MKRTGVRRFKRKKDAIPIGPLKRINPGKGPGVKITVLPRRRVRRSLFGKFI